MPADPRRVVAGVGRLLAAALLAGCAGTARAPHPRDPVEPLNRATWAFNEQVDRLLLKPFARLYRWVLPDFIERGIGNMFANLRGVDSAVSALLQGKLAGAGEETARIVVNTTVGLAGFFDPATTLGLDSANEDLGQTFAVWGFDESPYLELPVIGPSTLADLPDVVIQRLLPQLVLGPAWDLTVSATDGISTRAAALAATDARDAAALDPYAFTREAWLQKRRFLIHDGDLPVEDYEDLLLEDELLPEDGPLPGDGPGSAGGGTP